MRKETKYSVTVGRVVVPHRTDCMQRTREWGSTFKFNTRVEVRDYLRDERARYARNGWEIDIMFSETTTKSYHG